MRPRFPNTLCRFLVVALCGCGFQDPPSDFTSFSREVDQRCLELAAEVLQQTDWNDLGAPARSTGQDPFVPFEGRWRGRWGSLEMHHLWRSARPGVQLVLMKSSGPASSGSVARGINFQHEHALCGWVVSEEAGEERWIPHHAIEIPGGLRWFAPERRYDERVLHTAAGRRYLVEETWVGAAGEHIGERAVYHPE